MHDIQQTLYSFFKCYPERPIVIAYSGGIDSQVLLHALARLKQDQSCKQYLRQAITVCHVNHGLSPLADTWQQLAQRQCEALSLPLTVCPVEVKAKAQHSLEALARDARYQALYEICPDNALIVTGHHSDDQSETFLLALKRGSGLKGLSAMAEISPLSPHFSNATPAPKQSPHKNCSTDSDGQQPKKSHKNLQLVRPLLSLPRSSIEAYAKAQALTWVEDESNSDVSFDRNFIRHQVMPILKERWPSILHTISRSSEHCSEGQALLTELAEQDLAACLVVKGSKESKEGNQTLSIEFLNRLSTARFNNLIRHFLAVNHCLMPTSQQLLQIHLQLNAAADKTPAVKVGSHWLRRYQQHVYLTPDFKDVNTWQKKITYDTLSDNNEVTSELPDQLGHITLALIAEQNMLSICHNNQYHQLKAPHPAQQLIIRYQHDNPSCLPDFRQRKRPLKKVLQELSIAPWLRQRIAYLYYDQELVSALGYFICKPYLTAASHQES
jgi:tRNA(Ile)-lysidine synthase